MSKMYKVISEQLICGDHLNVPEPTRNFGLAGIEVVLLGAAVFLVVVDLVPRR